MMEALIFAYLATAINVLVAVMDQKSINLAVQITEIKTSKR